MSRFFDYLHQVTGSPKGALDDAPWPHDCAGKPGPASDVLSILYGRPDATETYNSERTAELKPVLVEEVQVPPSAHLVCHTDPMSPGADKFRLLRMRLRELGGPAKLKRLLITSSLPHEGKTTVAMNLAAALSEGGKHRVLVIDADLHQSSLRERLGLTPCDGLAECLTKGVEPLSVIRRLEPLKWYLLSTGSPPPNPTELLHDQSVAVVLRKVSQQFDWVIIDAPPVLPLTDAVSLRHHANATLLVARASVTPSKAIEDAMVLLGHKHVLGIVLNGIDRHDQLYSKYKSYYGRPRAVSKSVPG